MPKKQRSCHLRCLANASWWIANPAFEAHTFCLMTNAFTSFPSLWLARPVPLRCLAVR